MIGILLFVTRRKKEKKTITKETEKGVYLKR
jgi:hypothetical protein